MADLIAEIRQAIVRAVMQSVDTAATQRDWANRSAGNSPTNPAGASFDVSEATVFATGYSTGTGTTTAGFMFDASTLGGSDTFL